MEGSKYMAQYRRDPNLSLKYEMLELLGSGSFGRIYRAINKKTLQPVALKIQFYKNANWKLTTANQIKILQILKGKQGVPRIFSFGNWSKGAFMELQLLEESLKQKKLFKTTNIVSFALEFLKILQAIHAQNVIHQDLKPQNLMRSKEGKLYIIDFGLARIIPKNHIGMCPVGGFTGTPRYASIQAHLGMQQSKKDDLESAFYIIAYLYYQRLPWSKLKLPSQQKLEAIKKLKMKHNTTLFQDMPSQFKVAFDYISNLEPYAQPDYGYLKGIFKRHRSLVIIQSFQAERGQERTKVKKISLNMSNFLQVPQNHFHRRKKYQSDQISENDLNKNHQEPQISDRDQSINELSCPRIHIRSIKEIIKLQNGDFGQQQDIEPKLPKSMHFGKKLILKNPFQMMI